MSALADEARRKLARGTGRRPEDVELDVRVLPGSEDRVLLFREANGRSIALHDQGGASEEHANGIAAVLADLKIISGIGLGYRIIPGVLSAAGMRTLSHLEDGEGLESHMRAGASTAVASFAYVWELKDRPVPVGPAIAVSVPFVSIGNDPLLGDRVEFSIPGYVSVIAAVKRGEGNERDVGWIGAVWHQGLLGVGPGPTVNTKLVVGHPVLAAPLARLVGVTTAVVSPLMARIQALGRRKELEPASHEGIPTIRDAPDSTVLRN